jgi:hypothetical protein
MTAWNIIYFIIAILAALIGIWNLAQRKYIFLSIACLVWFLISLFTFIVQIGVIDFAMIGTTAGALALYGVMPILLIFAFFVRHNRS